MSSRVGFDIEFMSKFGESYNSGNYALSNSRLRITTISYIKFSKYMGFFAAIVDFTDHK